MTQKPIDEQTLNSLLDSIGGDMEFLRELVDTFFQDTPGQFASLRTALQNGDVEVFRRAAHSLKSNSASFGAMSLSRLCKQLEEAGKAGDLASVHPVLGEAEEEYARVKTALEKTIHGS